MHACDVERSSCNLKFQSVSPPNIRRITNPANVFEDSLYAMATLNFDLFSSYMTLHNVVNSQDSSGNTLLHYAVALGQTRTVKILCSKLVQSISLKDQNFKDPNVHYPIVLNSEERTTLYLHVSLSLI